MLREDVGTTFSDLWYRVAPTRPKLSVHARVIRQQYGPTVAYIVEEPASGQYYRLSASAYLFLGMLDGDRSVDDAWNASCERLGDDAPTQRECIELLSKLQMFGLLVGDIPLAPDMVLERKRQARETALRKRTGNWMFFSIPLFNPEPFLERHKIVIKLLFSRVGLVVWLATLLTAVVLVARNWSQFGSELNVSEMIAPTQLPVLAVVFLLLRAAHEMGHAAACKAMGGRSTEIGVLLIAVILPLPYCDATSAWRFPETWKRVLVSLAGMIVELFIAAIAAIVWVASSEQEGLVHVIAYRTMLIAGVTTMFFNLNPLLRYDGYYILSDLSGIPNLAQKSRQMWIHMIERYAYGLRGVKPPAVRSRSEVWLMMGYALLAVPYRVFVSVSILLLIMTRYAELGIAMAIVFGIAWLVWPLVKGTAYLVSSPKLLGRRGRAVGVVGAVLALLVIGFGVIPVPAAGYASGTIEARTQSAVRAGENGFIRNVRFEAGQLVQADDVIFDMESPDLATEVRVTKARFDGARVELAGAIAKGPAERRVAQIQMQNLSEAHEHARRRAEALEVMAPTTGRLAAPSGSAIDIANLEGRFVQRGDLLALVTSTDDLVVRAGVPDRAYAYIFAEGRSARASVRVRGMAGDAHPAHITRRVEAGSHRLHNPSLSTIAGGDVALDPRDREGGRSLESRFLVELEPEEPIEGVQPGMRVRVRFAIEPMPLGRQFVRRVRQFLSAKLAS
jgi:putative peptide zinc metalloprotease protein